MRLSRIRVTGELGFECRFNETNVILGENKTGKSTLLKLIVYALGTPVDDFVEEIAVQGLSKQVELDIVCKTGKSYRLMRALPDSKAIVIIPIDGSGRAMEEEAEVKNPAELSDFLLSEEGYGSQTVSYGEGKKATLRFYFLLRAAIVDQDTSAQEILANLGGKRGDFINNQALLKRAIIEALLQKDNTDIQRVRLRLHSATEERRKVATQLSFLEELLDQEAARMDIKAATIARVQDMLQDLNKEKAELSASKIDTLATLENRNADQANAELIALEQQQTEVEERIRSLELKKLDLSSALSSLQEEMDRLRKMVAARQVITQIPVERCPICLGRLDLATTDEGACPYCRRLADPSELDRVVRFQNLLRESIFEANQAAQEVTAELSSAHSQLSTLRERIADQKRAFLARHERDSTPIEDIINAVRVRLEFLSQREQGLKSLLNSLMHRDELKKRRIDLDASVKSLREELTQLDKESSQRDNRTLGAWTDMFQRILGYVFGDIRGATLDQNLMPVVDDRDVRSVSSASLKVAVRLAYVLSLFQLKDEADINHVGFVFFDSPKDKDLDTDKYQRFLNSLQKVKSGQVFLTGSITEKALYNQADVILELDRNHKLLRKATE